MKKSGFSKAFMPLALVCLGVLIVILQFGFIFLILALLPSVVAYSYDRGRQRHTFKVVCACNVAATLPSISPMLKSGIAMQHYDISSMLSDPTTWLFVYSGAAVGWALVFLCRYVARFVVMVMYEYNIATLEKLQKSLIDEWGQQVRQPPGLPAN